MWLALAISVIFLGQYCILWSSRCMVALGFILRHAPFQFTELQSLKTCNTLFDVVHSTKMEPWVQIAPPENVYITSDNKKYHVSPKVTWMMQIWWLSFYISLRKTLRLQRKFRISSTSYYAGIWEAWETSFESYQAHEFCRRWEGKIPYRDLRRKPICSRIPVWISDKSQSNSVAS